MHRRDPSPGVWRQIRLELAQTTDFSRGSASRAYILCLPLRDDGSIDEQVFEASPARATFRRFWPNEPDRDGTVVRVGDGWALSFRHAGSREAACPVALDRLLPGDEIMIAERGEPWPFRVIDLNLYSSPS